MKILNNNYSFLFFFIKKGILCILLGVFFSCSEKEVFSEFHSFSKAEWGQNDILKFQVPVYDTLSYYDVFLELRNNNDYPFRNIWLFIDSESPNGEVRSDTLNAELADIYGKWYGKGIGVYTYSFPYELHMQYKDTGTYVYSIRQGMRENPLKGISDIGLRVSKIAD